MDSNSKPTLVFIVTVVIIFAGFAAQAAPVSGAYEGTVDDDSGLGFLGENMRVDFTYDSTAVGSPSGIATFYNDFLLAFSVTVGTNVWTWNGADAGLFLWDDDVITTASEDRLQLSVSGFTGPQLVPNPFVGIAFSLFLSDIEPSGAPDGLSGDNSLASIAPNPSNFSGTGSVVNKIALTFTYGQIGNQTADLSALQFANVSAVPVPAAVWLFFGALPIVVRRLGGQRA